LYDTGSNISLLNYKIAKLLKLNEMTTESTLKTINGFSLANSRAMIEVRIGKITNNLEVLIIKNRQFSYDLLLGLDAIRKFSLIQDDNLKIHQRSRLGDDETTYKINFAEFDGFKEYVEHIPDFQQRNEILNVIQKYKRIFAIDKFDVGKVNTREAEIKLTENKYLASRPYKCSMPDEQEIRSQIKDLLQADLIEESDSPYSSPVTLAFKKEDGRKSRLCIDFRRLNKLIIPESQPFPTITDIIDKVVNCRYFSVLDINSAFWCITLKQEDREKTSFITKYGKFQFKVLPFGLKNAPAIFQRILANIIRRNNLDTFSVNYIDDILIFSTSWEEHISHLTKFMDAMRKEGFKLKLTKCRFASKSVKYLGHLIEENKVSPSNDNLIAIRNLKAPTDKSGVRSILGSINFYLKYIENSSQKLEPLHQLLRKNVPFEWTKECENVFQTIKDYLCSSPVLAIYDYHKPVYIDTDASYRGIGATLRQPQTNGLLQPVAYYSRKLSATELKMDVIHLECKAIKDAIKYWQYYLIGREFFVCTDHKPLENLTTKSRTDEILGDLVHYLSQFNFKIIYKRGKDNILADMLSRNPVLEYFTNEDIIQTVNLIELSDIQEDQEKNKMELETAKKTELHNGLVYKKIRQKSRVYISQTLGESLIDRAHVFYGHVGSAKLLNTLRKYYYFKNMDKLVKAFCETCTTCIQNKVRQRRAIGLMSKFGPASEPFEIMSLDTVGGFGGYHSTHRYMHLLVDHFSRYAWISTSTGQSAKDFIKFLKPIANKNRILILLTDQYSGINSDAFKTFLEEQGIQLVFTCFDCPQSNGLNERLNQTLVNRIRCKINSTKTRAWTSLAKECVVEYNRTVHSSTSFAPEYLLFGITSEICPIQHQSRLDTSLSEDRKRAFERSMKNFEINKSRVDKTRRRHIFLPGDEVYVANGNKLNRRKLSPVRVGPYKIIKQISSTFYELDCGKKKKASNFFHSTKLTPYTRSSQAEGEV
jgi:hypothetical protein